MTYRIGDRVEITNPSEYTLAMKGRIGVVKDIYECEGYKYHLAMEPTGDSFFVNDEHIEEVKDAVR